MENVSEAIVQLIGNEVCGNELHLPAMPDYPDTFYDKLFDVSSAHGVSHIVGTSLIKNGFDAAVTDKYRSSIYYVMFRSENLNYVFEKTCAVLEKARIPYVSLKGAVIRRLYPQYWLRTGCDIDILVKENDVERALQAITTELGYKETCRSDHDISILSAEKIFIELHFSLLGDSQSHEHSKVLAKVWDYVSPLEPGGFEYKLSEEMFYFYHIAHMAKHFSDGSCGIRPFLDLCLIKKGVNFKRDKLQQLLDESKLSKFEEAVSRLSDVWFSGAEHNKTTRIMQEYVFMGSSFGSPSTVMLSKQNKADGRLKYMLTRVFIPFDELRHQYPIIDKYKVLTPLCELARIFSLFFGKKRKFRRRYIERMAAQSDTLLTDIDFLFKSVGLR